MFLFLESLFKTHQLIMATDNQNFVDYVKILFRSPKAARDRYIFVVKNLYRRAVQMVEMAEKAVALF